MPVIMIISFGVFLDHWQIAKAIGRNDDWLAATFIDKVRSYQNILATRNFHIVQAIFTSNPLDR